MDIISLTMGYFIGLSTGLGTFIAFREIKVKELKEDIKRLLINEKAQFMEPESPEEKIDKLFNN